MNEYELHRNTEKKPLNVKQSYTSMHVISQVSWDRISPYLRKPLEWKVWHMTPHLFVAKLLCIHIGGYIRKSKFNKIFYGYGRIFFYRCNSFSLFKKLIKQILHFLMLNRCDGLFIQDYTRKKIFIYRFRLWVINKKRHLFLPLKVAAI